MNKYLIGTSDEFKPLMIVRAENEQNAIEIVKNRLEPSNSFIEYLHNWSTNMGFSEIFYYDQASEGQNDLPIKEIKKRTKEYFKEKPLFEQIYWKHWNGQPIYENTNHMALFPDDMIEFIWRKVLKEDDWMGFVAINLDEIEEI